jgi:hypothetical protein
MHSPPLSGAFAATKHTQHRRHVFYFSSAFFFCVRCTLSSNERNTEKEVQQGKTPDQHVNTQYIYFASFNFSFFFGFFFLLKSASGTCSFLSSLLRNARSTRYEHTKADERQRRGRRRSAPSASLLHRTDGRSVQEAEDVAKSWLRECVLACEWVCLVVSLKCDTPQ